VADQRRQCEAPQAFGPRFVTLARSRYRLNEERAWLKRPINDWCGSTLIEEKFHAGA
jgi:hypothetical protein